MTAVDEKMYYFYLSVCDIAVHLKVTLKRSLKRSANNIKTYKKSQI